MSESFKLSHVHFFMLYLYMFVTCVILSLNATDFLERLRGKRLVIVGDSLNRNMWESLVCILRHSIRRKKRVKDISGKREFNKQGFHAIRFKARLSPYMLLIFIYIVTEYHSFNGTSMQSCTCRITIVLWISLVLHSSLGNHHSPVKTVRLRH
jgi:hypothetical protein